MLGHPDCIKTELGMRLYVFKRLIPDLSDLGMAPSQHISLEEQVAIFLYMSVTLSSPLFYNHYIQLPDRDVPIAPEITSNPKFSSFFDNVIGAIDGTQVNCVPSSTEQQLTQVCLTEHEHPILLFHQGNTTWLMLDLQPVEPLSSHIDECNIILLSGVGPTSGMFFSPTANHSLLIAFRPSNKEELFNL
jgi:hypothetical protein